MNCHIRFLSKTSSHLALKIRAISKRKQCDITAAGVSRDTVLRPDVKTFSEFDSVFRLYVHAVVDLSLVDGGFSVLFSTG